MRNGLVMWASALVVCAGSSVVLADAAKVGLIEIHGSLQERSKIALPFASGGKGTTQMRDVLHGIENAAADPEIKGLCIQLKDAQLKGSQIEELGRAMKKVREAGKRVHVFAENYETRELQLGSYADEVIIQSGGAVSFPGVYMEEMFLADTFKWIGVTPDFVQIGDYKGASEQYANAKPSKAWDENINQLLDSMYSQVRAELKAGRKLDDKKLDAAMESAWMARAEDAKKAGLIDSIVDKPDLRKHLAKTYNADSVSWDDSLIPEHEAKLDGNPMMILAKLMEKPDHSPKRDTIAVLHIDGAIIDGDSSEGGLFGGSASVGSRTIRNALMEIEKNDMIKGCVVRIDSPGGSAIASEVIWQGLRRVADKKPVWASVGSMAASGGYYVAVGTDKVYVNPSSIVGSIGVVGGKLAMGGAYEKLKVNVVSRSRGPRAEMMSSSRAWSESERGLVRAKMTETYDQFAGRVSTGRKGIDLSKTAEGRLFLGEKAVALNMADKLGGLETAVSDLAAKLTLSERSYDVLDYPAPKGLGEMIEDMFGGMGGGGGASSPISGRSFIMGEFAAMGRDLVGPQNWESISCQIEGLMQLRREPVLLISPQAIIVK